MSWNRSLHRKRGHMTVVASWQYEGKKLRGSTFPIKPVCQDFAVGRARAVWNGVGAKIELIEGQLRHASAKQAQCKDVES